MPNNGFKVQLYIDVRLAADLILFYKDKGKLMPNSLSELMRRTLQDVHDQLVDKEVRITSLAEAIEILEAQGYSTTQFKTKSKQMAKLIDKDDAVIEVSSKAPSSWIMVQLKCMDNGWEGLTELEQDVLEEAHIAGNITAEALQILKLKEGG